jgi:hypothetical protein
LSPFSRWRSGTAAGLPSTKDPHRSANPEDGLFARKGTGAQSFDILFGAGGAKTSNVVIDDATAINVNAPMSGIIAAIRIVNSSMPQKPHRDAQARAGARHSSTPVACWGRNGTRRATNTTP